MINSPINPKSEKAFLLLHLSHKLLQWNVIFPKRVVAVETRQRIPHNPQEIIENLELHNIYRFKQFYKPTEMASLLGITYPQVRYAITHYHLDAILIGWIWRVPYNAIIRFMEDKKYRVELVASYYDWIASREMRN